MKKIIYIIIVGLLLNISLKAQSPNLIWEKTFGAEDAFNQSLDCTIDGSGFLYVVGYTNYYPHGNFLILKYNSTTGDTVWKKTFNGNPGNSSDDNDIAMGCVLDGSGNLYVTGMSSNSNSNTDILTIKYNTSTGDTIWTRRYNGVADGNDAGTECALDANGNLYVTGMSYSGTYTDICLLKYNYANGSLIWSHNYPSPLNNKGEAYGCSVSGSDIFINGYIYSGTTYKLYTIKSNNNGDTLWTRVNNEGLDSLNYIHSDCIADNSGNVYTTGNCSNSTSGIYGRTIKYSTSGIELWSKKLENPPGSKLNDALYGATIDNAGNLIVTGTTYGVDTFANNLILIRYNSATGDTIWTKIDKNGRTGMSCTLDAADNLYVTGLPKDFWGCLVMKFDHSGQVEIANETFIEKIVSIHPNPVIDFATIKVNRNSNEAKSLNIYNTLGKLVKIEKMNLNQQQIYFGDLSNGIYLVNIKSKDFSENHKIIIQR